MPKDKMISHQLVRRSAKQEFLEKGFEKASMRTIAKEAGLTVGALYKHFCSKEEMFTALVEPVYQEVLALNRQKNEATKARLKQHAPDLYQHSLENIKVIVNFIYAHSDEFQLMFNCSAGTPFEQVREWMIDLEVDDMKAFLAQAEESGMGVVQLSDLELHIFAAMSLTPIFEVITHQFAYDEAIDMLYLTAQAQYYAWEKIISSRKK